MGLLNKNEKTSNIFYEDVKSVISKMAELLNKNGFIPYDDWEDADEILTPILGPSMYGLPKNASVLVFKRSWTGSSCSIYIIDKLEKGRVAYHIGISSQHSGCFERHITRIPLHRSKNMNLIFKLSDNMMKKLLNETYGIA
nr:MAG TPA: hypothetical protein [Caudoviricetes sp.]